MIRALQLWLAPLAGAALTLWALVVSLAADAPAPLARALAGEGPAPHGARPDARLPSVPRQLRLVHATLLVLAAALAGTSVGWWERPFAEALPRFLLPALLVWLVGDLLPRVLGALAPDLVLVARGPARVTRGLFQPLFRALAWLDRRSGHLGGGGGGGGGSGAGAGAGAEGEAAGEPGPGPDPAMLHGIFALRDMTVAEVMTPRIDIVAVPLAFPRERVVHALRESGHSRLLVFETSPDQVVGAIYAKDLLPRPDRAEADWKALIRPAAFVPEAKTLAAQLRDFQRGPTHLAVVVDEFGGTAGLLTLEDILEQIVGEIQDEYDEGEAAPILAQADGRWVVQGGIPLAELEAHLGYRFEREDVDTVGGLVLASLGRVPRGGEALAFGPYRLTVDHMVGRRVARVIVEAAERWPAVPSGKAP